MKLQASRDFFVLFPVPGTVSGTSQMIINICWMNASIHCKTSTTIKKWHYCHWIFIHSFIQNILSLCSYQARHCAEPCRQCLEHGPNPCTWKWTNFYWACHYPLWESRRSWSMSFLRVILCLGHGSTLVLAQHLPVGPFGLQCCSVCVCWSTHSAMLLGSRTVAWSPVGLPCYSKGGPGAATSPGSLTEMPNLWPHPDFLKVRVCSIIKPPCGFTHTNLKHKEKSRLDIHWESAMCKAVR